MKHCLVAPLKSRFRGTRMGTTAANRHLRCHVHPRPRALRPARALVCARPRVCARPHYQAQTAFGSSAGELSMRSTPPRAARTDLNIPTKPLNVPYLTGSSRPISEPPTQPTRLRPQRRASHQTAPKQMGSECRRPRGMAARWLATTPRRTPSEPLPSLAATVAYTRRPTAPPFYFD